MFDERGRPTIIGRFMTNKAESNDQCWHRFSMGTKEVLKKPELMKCMTYFPVVFKVRHVEEMLEYIESVHGKRFVDVMSSLPPEAPVSQFGVMCSYAWYFHREEYDWHIQQAEGEVVGGLKGGLPLEELKGLLKDKSLTEPVVRTADHYKYCVEPKDNRLLNHIGYCVTCKETDACKGLEKYDTLANCSALNLGRINETFFRFEKYSSSWMWEPRVSGAYKKHFGSVKKMVERGYWKYDTKLLDGMVKGGLF